MRSTSEFRNPEMPAMVGLSEYFDAVARNCPFAQPAKMSRYTRFTVYPGSDFQTEDVLLITLLHMEILRHEYIASSGDTQRWLLNENIIFGNTQSADLKEEFIKTHWFLTVLYTVKGWVFGKFAKNSYPKERTDIVVSEQQINLFSIRALIPERDNRFYEKIPGLQGDLSNYTDDGVPPLSAHHGLLIIVNLCNVTEVLKRVEKMKQVGFYRDLEARVRALEQERGLSFSQRYTG